MQPGDWARVTKPLYGTDGAPVDVMPCDRLIYLATVMPHWTRRWEYVEPYWETDTYPTRYVEGHTETTRYDMTAPGYHVVMRPGNTVIVHQFGRRLVKNPLFKIPLHLLRGVEKPC